jgi:hypothetical protein
VKGTVPVVSYLGVREAGGIKYIAEFRGLEHNPSAECEDALGERR